MFSLLYTCSLYMFSLTCSHVFRTKAVLSTICHWNCYMSVQKCSKFPNHVGFWDLKWLYSLPTSVPIQIYGIACCLIAALHVYLEKISKFTNEIFCCETGTLKSGQLSHLFRPKIGDTMGYGPFGRSNVWGDCLAVVTRLWQSPIGNSQLGLVSANVQKLFRFVLRHYFLFFLDAIRRISTDCIRLLQSFRCHCGIRDA